MATGNFAPGTPRGLMAFWSDIALPNQPAYQRWHNNEHIPERLSVPGFVRGRRYRSVTHPLRFLMYYDTADLGVLTSAAYLARLNAPTPRTSAALRWFENGNRTAYHLVGTTGPLEHEAAPVIAVARFAPPAGGAAASEEVHRLRQSAMQRLAQAAGLERVLEYRLDDAGSSVSTGEASVHNAARSAVDGLLVLHSRDLALLDEPAAWAALDEAVAQWAALNAIADAPRMEVYSLEFALQNNNDPETEGRS